MSSRSLLASAALSAALAITALAHGQDGPEQLVWLKGGGFVRGTLLELIPGDHVTLKLASGEVKRFSYADIERTAAAGSPPPASSSPTPSASPSPAPSPSPSSSSPAPPSPASASPGPAGGGSPAGAEGRPKRPETAVVKIFSRGAAVELQAKAKFEDGSWEPACASPCGSAVKMTDREFRVGGEGVTPSNPFRMEPGDDTIKLEVNPGAQWARDWGRRGLIAGVPLFLLGGVGIGIDAGTNVKGRETIGAVGIGAAITGAAMILVAVPLLLTSSTRVKNQKGEIISLGQGGLVF